MHKKIIMKNLNLLFGIYFLTSSWMLPLSQTISSIELQNSSWKIDGKCLETENEDGFVLCSYSESTGDIASRWGYFISFSENTFQTSYRAPCGVDCFTSVSGTYQWLAPNKMELFVSKISRRKYCNESSENPDKSFGIYMVGVENDKVIFQRI